MNKKWVTLFITCSMLATAWSQTLITYGKYSIDAREFLRAYNKNNSSPVLNKTKALTDYLDLYIRSRLKIREAYERGYDTLPHLREELANLRSQIIETYMNDPETLDKLVKEAFHRSQKDIHVAHIYIGFKNLNGEIDTAFAEKKIKEAQWLLQNGKDFLEVARKFSEDPSVLKNKGDIGYITVFSLPYEFENIIYTTPIHKHSTLYKSKSGYHIFKNLGERKALGRMNASQILLAFPPGADEASKKQTAQLADSLYRRLLKGDDFAKLASRFSHDFISASAGGLMQAFSVGQYDPIFEKTVFSLPKNGAISKPFETSHGYHIVKRISIAPVITDVNNKSNMLDLRNKIELNDRVDITKKAMYDKVVKTAGFKKMEYPPQELMALTDSLLDFRPASSEIKMTRESPLFKLGDRTITVQEWINYAQSNRSKADGSGVKPFNQVMDEFVQSVAVDYYRNHLEDFNKEFDYQLNEFKDGNMFFEIMQRDIWSKAQSDSLALKQFYEKNKSKYVWNKSADAVIFYCADKSTAKLLFNQLTRDPAAWKTAAASQGDKVIIDSSRYELAQIPNPNKMIWKKGMITNPVINKNDNSASFAYIIKMYPQPAMRTFSEARGLVSNDYQNYLEEIWIRDLKMKYPVKVNEKVLHDLVDGK